MRHHPCTSFVFCLYWYSHWRRKHCCNTNTHTNCSHSSRSSSHTTSDSNVCPFTNAKPNPPISANTTAETDISSLSGNQWQPVVLYLCSRKPHIQSAIGLL